MIGNRWSDHQPIVMYQEQHILPTALAHFDSLWIADHFYGFDAKTDPFLEGWTTLTWLAAKFPDVLLCHHVLGHGYRPPALTAKMASTLQTLSGGRFILGIGAGWREDEYRAYGYEFPRPAVRFAQLAEVIEICRLMWTDPDPTYHGEYFQIDGAAASPLPEVVPPICIGASGEQIGLPLVGRMADIWNGSSRGTDDDWRRRVDIVQTAAAAAGRDPADIEISTTLERALARRRRPGSRVVRTARPQGRARRAALRHGLRPPSDRRARAAFRRAGHGAVAGTARPLMSSTYRGRMTSGNMVGES